jgi:hypothetical protein
MVVVAGIHSIFSYNMHCYESFSGFSDLGWMVLFNRGLCQLMAWLSISYATQHMRPQNFLSLLGQAVLTSIGLDILDEKSLLI